MFKAFNDLIQYVDYNNTYPAIGSGCYGIVKTIMSKLLVAIKRTKVKYKNFNPVTWECQFKKNKLTLCTSRTKGFKQNLQDKMGEDTVDQYISSGNQALFIITCVQFFLKNDEDFTRHLKLGIYPALVGISKQQTWSPRAETVYNKLVAAFSELRCVCIETGAKDLVFPDGEPTSIDLRAGDDGDDSDSWMMEG